MPYKVKETLRYSEWVFYDDNDNEIGRERLYDDSLWDEGPREALTEDDLEDYAEELS